MATHATIMHVEDDADILEIVRLTFEVAGHFDIKQFASGDAALAAAHAFVPDIMLLDFMLPGISGEELLLTLRKLDAYKNIPTIFVTASAFPVDRQRFMSMGAAGVIVKPFQPHSLISSVLSSLPINKLSVV